MILTSFLLLFLGVFLNIDCTMAVGWDLASINNIQTPLLENTPIGTVLGTVLFVPSPPVPVTYSIAGDSSLSINPTSGVVTVAKTLSFDQNPVLSNTIFASYPGQSSSKLIIINVLQFNNPPTYDSPAYSFSVNDQTPVNTILYNNIYVTDPDSNQLGIVTVSCNVAVSPDCQYFAVGLQKVTGFGKTNQVTITSRQPFNFKTKSSYQLLLIAQDNGSPPLSTAAAVTVDITSSQDMRPVFQNTPLLLQIKEKDNTYVINPALNITVTNPTPNTNLVFTIQNDPKNWFSVSSANPVGDSRNSYIAGVRLVRPISLADNGMITQYSFNLVATVVSNGQLTSLLATTSVLVNILGVNVFQPTFNQPTYSVMVQDGLGFQTTLPGLSITIADNDLGINAFFNISISQQPFPAVQIFTVLPTYAQGVAAVAILVNRPDYLVFSDPARRYYTINLTAFETKSSEKYSSSALVNVTVFSSSNSAPFFPQISNPISIPDNQAVGTVVSNLIQAIDANQGAYGIITYSITSQDATTSYFAINPSSGVITLARKLNYNTGPTTFIFQVVATDGGGLTGSTPIRVDVTDSSKKGPQFNQPIYTANVQETGTNLNPPITFRAFTTSLTSDVVINYKLIDGGPPGPSSFIVDPVSGILTLTRPIPYGQTPRQQGFFDLIVQANIAGYPELPVTNVTCRIFIMGINLNPPVFVKPQSYFSTIMETTPPLTPILVANASDADFGMNALVHYLILDGSKDNFIMDYNTGLISVGPSADLEIDRFGSQYNMTVLAFDVGTPSLTGTATVYITVKDNVYRKPFFGQNQYTFTVQEMQPVGVLIGPVTARSLDQRALISYQIVQTSYQAFDQQNKSDPANVVNNWFRIDPNAGSLSISDKILFATAVRVHFNVMATVTNGEVVGQILSAIVPVTVNILQQNILIDSVVFSPQPGQDNIIVKTIYEKQPVGAVVQQLQAFLITGTVNNSPVSNFQLQQPGSDTQGFITLNPTTGTITIAKPIIYADLKLPLLTYLIKAIAPLPSLSSAVVEYNLIILPFGNTNPVFDFQLYNFDVDSNAISGSQVGTVNAFSPLNHSVLYNFVTPVNSQSNVFNLDPNTGIITINQKLDELKSSALQYIQNVQAADATNPQYVSQAVVTIKVNPIHTIPPAFTQSVYTFYGQLNKPDFSLGQVLAFDNDPFTRSDITYSILSTSPADALDFFSIDPNLGIIQTTKELRAPSNGNSFYALTVQAKDQATPSLTSTANVKVQMPQSGIQLTFNSPDGNDISAFENVFNSQIIQVNGTTTGPGPIVYSFSTSNPADQNKFNINPNTGLLTVNGLLKRKDASSYSIILSMNDNGVTQTKFVTLNVYNNSPPTFTCKNNRASFAVLDNSPVPVLAHNNTIPVELNTPCSYNKPGTQFFYQIKNPDSTLSETSASGDFTINNSTGDITVNNVQQLYLNVNKTITVVIAANKNQISTAAENPSSQLIASLVISPAFGHAPSFSSTNPYCPGVGSNVVANILDMSPIGTPVITMTAGDCDAPGYRTKTYSITNLQYHLPIETDKNQEPKLKTSFIIDPVSGLVRTNMVNFRSYYLGQFILNAQVVKNVFGNSVYDTVKLTIYIVRETQKLKFVFNKPVGQTNMLRSNLTRQVQGLLAAKGDTIYSDNVTTYVGPDGARNIQWSSLCYFLVSKNQDVYVKQDAQNLMSNIFLTNVNQSASQIKTNFNLIDVNKMCYETTITTTKWWSDYWFLWYILIAFAIFLFFVALILTCCVLCYWPINVRNMNKSKPYVVLDDNPISQAGSVME